ncbi:ATP-dependent DNA helicase [Microthyrium microscopicum]|uniref:ATP-dependent DNA helicase n=1 Tax=Microthyrium microscopicum TaxID=703497 RepID=A0A6A6TYN4_9PEZI|nr:ATP-dependent DNA helicase [Microthyrium microscopicum]
MSHSDGDEFGFSSGDEEALLAIPDNPQPSGMKRKSDSNDQDFPSKRHASSSQEFTNPAIEHLAQKLLIERFGIPKFRLEQKAAVSRLLHGKNAVVVFPTGGGKSLCYQLPAIVFPELDRLEGVRGPDDHGISIVVSPLIALMKDQVDALLKKGIAAAAMDSSKSREEFLQLNSDIREGRIRLLYCAPERLNNEGFVSSIKFVRGGVRMIAIDEAHCISEWGHSFRPDYLKVARFASEIKAERVVCLTATATPKVADDICKVFDVDSHGLFRTPMYRPNLELDIQVTQTKLQKFPHMFKFLRANPGPTVIYVTIQKQTEALAEDLRAKKFKARAFHSGLPTELKTQVQQEFMEKDDIIIVATIAFGMGIDKSNIRNVIHFDLPSSVESYSQQIGRAGRDGLKSKCVFYLCPEDFYLREIFIYGDLPSRDSVSRFLNDVFKSEHVALDVGETIEVSQYAQAREFDIRPNTLSILYAQLELKFGLIRATGSKYAQYSFEATHSYYQAQSAQTPAANAIKRYAAKAKTLHHIDAGAASSSSGVVRADIVRQLNDWDERGIIKLKASGVTHLFRIEQKLPSKPENVELILNGLYKEMEDKEHQEMIRSEQVMSLITGASCLSRGIAAYFGDTSMDFVECGHCSWCKTHKAIEFKPLPARHTSQGVIAEILAATDVRDDPRFLARVAFGIQSPRITALKLSSHNVFRSLGEEGYHFLDLLREFTIACGTKASSAVAASAPSSRTSSTSKKGMKPGTKLVARSSSASKSSSSYKSRGSSSTRGSTYSSRGSTSKSRGTGYSSRGSRGSRRPRESSYIPPFYNPFK